MEMTRQRLLAHIAAAQADAIRLEAGGHFTLARCRQRDAAWLRARLIGQVAAA